MSMQPRRRTSSRIGNPCAPPRFRTLVSIIGIVAVLIFTLLASNYAHVPIASAQTATVYDLCQRTPAVQDAILTELRRWGSAQTPTADTRYAAASNFGCAAGQSAPISATDLAAHAGNAAGGWNSWSSFMEFGTNGSQLSELKAGDFAGLNVRYIRFLGTNLETFPARVFDGVPIQVFILRHNLHLSALPSGMFDGINIQSGAQFYIEDNPLLAHDNIAPDAFDPIGNPDSSAYGIGSRGVKQFVLGTRGAQSANNPYLYSRLAHINTRWFQTFRQVSTGSTGWGLIELRGHHLDTFYYDDGSGRYTDGSKGTPGETNIADKTALGNAITAEINRTSGASDGPDLTGSKLDLTRTVFGSYDLCNPAHRTPAVRDAIVAELRANAGQTIKGAAVPATYSSSWGECTTDSGGRLTQSVTISRTDLRAHTLFDHPDLLDLSGRGLTRLNFTDFKDIDARKIIINRDRLGQSEPNVIPRFPDRLFAGLNLTELWIDGIGLEELQSELFSGTLAPTSTTFVVFSLKNNPRLSDVKIAPDVFDNWNELSNIYLDNNGIGRINTRWFQTLTGLGTQTYNVLSLDGLPVVQHYYNLNGGYYDAGARDKVQYDPLGSASANQEALRTAIATEIAAYATRSSITNNANLAGARFVAPDGLGISPCDRHEAVWKELMRQFEFINDDIAQARGEIEMRHAEVGNIRHERYANISQSDCRVLWAQWVNRSTGNAISDQSSPNGATDALSIIPNIYHESSFFLRGSDLSTQKVAPSDFANMFGVRRLYLDDTGLSNPSAALFSQMPKITHLFLQANSLTDSDLSGQSGVLSGLNNLVQLQLDDNLLTSFDSDWLSAASRRSLTNLTLSGNPLTTTDLQGLNLLVLDISKTALVELDPAIAGMTNLQYFWWREINTLPYEGLPAFISGLPSGLVHSIPGARLGNPGDLEDAEFDIVTRDLALDIHAKMRQINSAAGGAQVNVAFLADPCRPRIGTFGWATDYGDFCLTNAQRDSFIASLSEFDALNNIVLMNTNLTDAQTAELLTKAAQQGVGSIHLEGNPNAFGTGYNDASLSVFRQFDDLRLLRSRGSDLNHTQANTILRNLETALASDQITSGGTVTRREGPTIIDLGFNPSLFTGVTPADLRNFMRGIYPYQVRNRFAASPQNLYLYLNGTDLSFDQLKVIIDSIEAGQSPGDLRQLRVLNLAGNTNLWKRQNQSNEWVDVPDTEVEALLARLPGLTRIYINDTGISSSTMLEAIFDGLDADAESVLYGDIRDDSALERLTELGLSDNDLSGVSTVDLDARFEDMGERIALSSAPLKELELANTGITLSQLEAIADGLETAGLLDGIVRLDISRNTALFDATECANGDASDPLAVEVARFTNLRYLDVSGSGLNLNQLQCIAEGMDEADESPNDNVASNAVSVNLRNNPDLFDDVDDATESAAPAAVATAMAPFAFARTYLVNTGITIAQATAIANARAEGQSREEQSETQRRFAAQNPAFGFNTPLPDNTRVLTGRASLRVAFTHDPMHDGDRFTVLRYEYRYRPRSDDPWGTTGTQQWRTASLDLNTPGDKHFDIFGLETETIYQVQLRASSVARPSTVTLTGGTAISLPLIKRIEPSITEVSLRAGDRVRLEVDVYGTANRLDNTIPDRESDTLIFTWSDTPSGGSFAEPNDGRRVTYTAPDLPGTYTISTEAGPDGVCIDHHNENFGIAEADREPCQAKFTVRVTRAPVDPDPPAEPINPSGTIPSSLTDADGTAYTVFTPADGGTFTGSGITITASAGAIPDRQPLGVSAAASEVTAPEPTPGARMTIAPGLFEINAIQAAGDAPVQSYALAEPIAACIPLPEDFRANISDVVMVERKADASYGIVSTTLRQTAGELAVCGSISKLPATVGVAKLGIVPEPPATPTPEGPEPPDTGATAPSTSASAMAIALGLTILAIAAAALSAANTIRRRRSQI